MTISFSQHFETHVEGIRASLSRLESDAEASADAIVRCLSNGGKILAFGNGGSAAEAGHFAEELVGRYRQTRRPLPAISLAADSGALTCIANDFGYEAVFERQIDAFLQKGDVAIGLTTSGRSPNVIKGLRCAHERGGVTIALTGRAGIAEVQADHVVAVPSDDSAIVQEVHLMIIHYWCEAVEREVPQ